MKFAKIRLLRRVMDYNYNQKHLKIIQFGLIVNLVAVVILTIFSVLNVIAGTDTLFNMLFIVTIRIIVLGFNVYAYNFMKQQKSKQAVTLALLMAIAGILSTNLLGSLIVIYGYLRIRKYDLVSDQEKQGN